MHSLGDENNVGDTTFSKFAVIITTMNLLFLWCQMDLLQFP